MGSIENPNKVYVVLGASPGEWRSWVEGVYLTYEEAYQAMETVEEQDDWDNSYYIESGELMQ